MKINVILFHCAPKLLYKNVIRRTSFAVHADLTASLDEGKIDRLVEVLQEKFNDIVSLNPAQYEVIKNDIPKRTPRVISAVKIQPKQAISNELELEAMALEIELALLEFAA